MATRKYETMFILRPELDEAQQTALIDRFSSVITENGGEVVKVDRWGKRRLTYEIGKLREGYYVVIKFTGDTGLEKELTRVYKITDGVIRNIIVLEED
ncbi:MAG TPA: 30S ribosomal protein S6 [Spirochaetia bacterium]|nr:30S ribosomal protein S6 [Spirochaetia bacterium]